MAPVRGREAGGGERRQHASLAGGEATNVTGADRRPPILVDY